MLMLSGAQRDLVRDKGTILGRALIGLLFFAGGLSMLFLDGVESTTAMFINFELPFPSLLVWVVIVLKIVAGGAIIIGKRVGLAAAALIGFTFLATTIAHKDFADPGLFKNLAIIGGLLYLMAYGPGGSNTKKLSSASQGE